jgi:glutamate-1-semialdehyde aminotransferase
MQVRCAPFAARPPPPPPPPMSPAPSAPAQDTIQQLHNTLKSSEAVLSQHHAQIAGVLADLDPVQHSLGYLFLL